MDKNEKIREHIMVPVANNVSFFDIVVLFGEIVKDILDDELVAFSFINEQGLVVGSESVYPVESYLYDDETLFRAFTQQGRWRLSAIRRERDGSVTLVEILAPIDTAEKMPEVIDYLIIKLNGIKAAV